MEAGEADMAAVVAADTEAVVAADTEAEDMAAAVEAMVVVAAAMEVAVTAVVAAATVAADIEKQPPPSGINQITCIGKFRRVPSVYISRRHKSH